MHNYKFGFIGGLHKSGTSLLFKSLRDHPQISGFKDTGVPQDEGQHLQSVYSKANAHGGPGRFGFDPTAYLNENSSLVSADNAQKIFSEWENYWDLEKPLLLEKSPPNLIRTRFLQALFPASYFIIVLRHPIAISYAQQKYKGQRKNPIHILLEHCLVCYEQFDADREYLRNLLVLKYEDFVRAPQATLNEIYTFLGVDNDSLAQKVRSDINDKYFSTWREVQQDKQIKSYADDIISKFEGRANHFGYSLKDLDQLKPY